MTSGRLFGAQERSNVRWPSSHRRWLFWDYIFLGFTGNPWFAACKMCILTNRPNCHHRLKKWKAHKLERVNHRAITLQLSGFGTDKHLVLNELMTLTFWPPGRCSPGSAIVAMTATLHYRRRIRPMALSPLFLWSDKPEVLMMVSPMSFPVEPRPYVMTEWR